MKPEILKAAVLLSSLDQAAADSLLIRLPAEQADAIVRASEAIADWSTEQREQVIAEFLGGSGGLIDIDIDEEPTILPFPEISESDTHVLAFADMISDAVLGTLLGEEHPQTAAVVLAHLPPQRASSLLSCFSATARADVLRRVAKLTDAECELLPEIADALRERASQPQPEAPPQSPGFLAAQAIVAAAGDSAEALVGELQYADASLAHRLRMQHLQAPDANEPSLTFHELQHLSNEALAKLFSRCQPEEVLLALAGAETTFTQRMLAQLSPAEAAAFETRMRRLAPLRLSDVEQAQNAILETAETLIKAGEIEPPSQPFAAAA